MWECYISSSFAALFSWFFVWTWSSLSFATLVLLSSNLDGWPSDWFSSSELVLVYLLHEFVHESIDVDIFFSRNIIVFHVLTWRHLLCLLGCNLAFIIQVDLISYKNFCNASVCMLLYLLKPHSHVIERFLVGHIETQNDTLCLFVERQRQCSKSFLSCSVPNFHLHLLAIRWLVCLAHKIKSKSSQVIGFKLFLSVHFEKWRLTDGLISEDNNVYLLLSCHKFLILLWMSR